MCICESLYMFGTNCFFCLNFHFPHITTTVTYSMRCLSSHLTITFQLWFYFSAKLFLNSHELNDFQFCMFHNTVDLTYFHLLFVFSPVFLRFSRSGLKFSSPRQADWCLSCSGQGTVQSKVKSLYTSDYITISTGEVQLGRRLVC